MKDEDQEMKEINKYSGAEEGLGGDGSGAGEDGDNNGSNFSIGGGNTSCYILLDGSVKWCECCFIHIMEYVFITSMSVHIYKTELVLLF